MSAKYYRVNGTMYEFFTWYATSEELPEHFNEDGELENSKGFGRDSFERLVPHEADGGDFSISEVDEISEDEYRKSNPPYGGKKDPWTRYPKNSV